MSSDSRNDGTAAKDSVEARLAEQRRALDLRTRPMAAISEMDWDLPDDDEEAAAPDLAPESAAASHAEAAPAAFAPSEPPAPEPPAPEPPAPEPPAPEPPASEPLAEFAPAVPPSEPALPSLGGGTLLMSADALRQLAGGSFSPSPPADEPAASPAAEPSASASAPSETPQPEAPAEGPKPALTAPVPLPPTGTLRLSAAEIQRLMPSGASSTVPEPAPEPPASTVHASAGGGHVEAAPVAGTPAPAPAPMPMPTPEPPPAAYAPPAPSYGAAPQAPPPGPPAHIANELDGVVPPASEQGVQPSSGGVPRILFVVLFFVLIAVLVGGYFLVRTFFG